MHKPLTTTLLFQIPIEQREALRLAVISLDSDRINAIISQITVNEPELGQALSQLANEFDYPSILKAISATSNMGDTND
jgi:hypothetical protein